MVSTSNNRLSLFGTFAPQDYANPDNFRTEEMDKLSTPRHAKMQYRKGYMLGRESRRIAITTSGTIAAELNDGGVLSSYEIIGYHAHTAELLRGILDSQTPIVVYRRGQSEPVAVRRIVVEPDRRPDVPMVDQKAIDNPNGVELTIVGAD
jgi:hypothetical protein